MKILTVAFAAFVGFGASVTSAKTVSIPEIKTNIVEHGGGCRKDSPPGQCCHRDNSTGTSHCH